jgi:hypothetical protein
LTVLFLSDTPLFLFNGCLFLPQLFPHPFTLGLLGCGVGRIIFIGLCSTFLLFAGLLLANLCSPKFPNALLNRLDVNQLPNNFFGFVVHA